MVLYSFLAVDLWNRSGGDFESQDPLVRATQFFLIPVSIAFQEDLLNVGVVDEVCDKEPGNPPERELEFHH